LLSGSLLLLFPFLFLPLLSLGLDLFGWLLFFLF
jgi:hypothetical protein